MNQLQCLGVGLITGVNKHVTRKTANVVNLKMETGHKVISAYCKYHHLIDSKHHSQNKYPYSYIV